jgi:hypothetical protein
MFADNIVWDIDLEEGKTYKSACAELKLPKRVELPKRFWPENGDPLKAIADWLSNEYGYRAITFVVR